MFNDYLKLQRFPLAILTFSQLFSLKSGGYAYQETSKPALRSLPLTLPLACYIYRENRKNRLLVKMTICKGTSRNRYFYLYENF